MKAIVLLLTMVLLTGAAPLHGSDYPLRRTEKGLGAVYVFMDEASCLTSTSALRATRRIADAYSIPVVVFRVGADSLRGARYAISHLRMATDVIYDELYAHPPLFDVAQLPMALVLGKSGHEYYRAQPGRIDYDLDSLDHYLALVTQEDYTRSRFGLANIETLSPDWSRELADTIGSSTPLQTSLAYHTTEDVYYLLVAQRSAIFRLDSMGVVLDELPTTKIERTFRSVYPIIYGHGSRPGDLFIWDNDMYSAHSVYSVVNYYDRSCTLLPQPDSVQMTTTQFVYEERSQKLIAPFRCSPRYHPAFSETRPSMAVFDGSQWTMVGRYRLYNTNEAFNGRTRTSAAFSDSRIIAHQNFSRWLDVYDLTSMKHDSLSLDTLDRIYTQLECFNPADMDTIIEHDWTSDAACMLQTGSVFVDTTSSYVVLTQMYQHSQNPGHHDPTLTDGWIQYILVLIDPGLRRIERILQLPINTVPRHIADGVAHCVYLDNGRLGLARYRLPKRKEPNVR